MSRTIYFFVFCVIFYTHASPQCGITCRCCTRSGNFQIQPCDELDECIDPEICQAEGNFVELPHNATAVHAAETFDSGIVIDFPPGVNSYDVEVVPSNPHDLQCMIESNGKIIEQFLGPRTSWTSFSLTRHETFITGLTCQQGAQIKTLSIKCNQPIVFNLPHRIELLQTSSCCKGDTQCERAGSESFCDRLSPTCNWDCCNCVGEDERCGAHQTRLACAQRRSCTYICTEPKGNCCTGAASKCGDIQQQDHCTENECDWRCDVSDTLGFGTGEGTEGGAIGGDPSDQQDATIGNAGDQGGGDFAGEGDGTLEGGVGSSGDIGGDGSGTSEHGVGSLGDIAGDGGGNGASESIGDASLDEGSGSASGVADLGDGQQTASLGDIAGDGGSNEASVIVGDGSSNEGSGSASGVADLGTTREGSDASGQQTATLGDENNASDLNEMFGRGTIG